MDPKDRRQFPRIEGQFSVDLLNMGDDPNFPPFEAVITGVALDISKRGIRLKSAYNATVGSFISAIVYYRSTDSIALCEVMWKRIEDGQFHYGLYIKEWSELDPLLLEQLNILEEQHKIPPHESERILSRLPPKTRYA